MNDHLKLFGQAKSSWIYPIYVPSYNRAGDAPLLDILAQAPASVRRKVHIQVRAEQAADYRAAYPWAEVITHRGPYGVGPARAACFRHAEECGHERIVMIDDDVTHISLMERIVQANGKHHTRRQSEKITGMPVHQHLPRALAVGCYLATRVFELVEAAAYGSGRQGLFSGDVDPTVGAFMDKGGFPACLLFFDLTRFTWRDCPKPYREHGEDLSMFLHTLNEGNGAFVIPTVAYDTKTGIESTIPLDPLDAAGRQPDLDAAADIYPGLYPYLRATMRNKAGGVMKIGVHWPQWYKDQVMEPTIIPMNELI